MSNSQTSSRNPRFAVLAIVVMAAAVGALVLLAKPLGSVSRGVVYSFASAAFDHHDYGAAVIDLKYYYTASIKSLNLETKADLEKGSDAAVTTAQQAHELDPSDQTTTLLLGAAYALNGRGSDLASLMASQKAPEALYGLESLRTANLAQAQELYVLGLLRSSGAVLATIPAASTQRSILQAEVALGLQPGRAGASAASPFATEAVLLDPSNVTAQKLFISVSRKTGDRAAADQHQVLVEKLEAGTP